MDFWHREACYESIRPVIFCLIFTAMLLYIVNNGKILTDTRNKIVDILKESAMNCNF